MNSIGGNTLQNNTLDTQSVNACDSSPVEMQTPEEFSASVFSIWSYDDCLPLGTGTCQAKHLESPFTEAYIDRQTALLVAIGDKLTNPEVVEEPLQAAIDYAFKLEEDLVLFGRNFEEIDRWEYKP